MCFLPSGSIKKLYLFRSETCSGCIGQDVYSKDFPMGMPYCRETSTHKHTALHLSFKVSVLPCHRLKGQCGGRFQSSLHTMSIINENTQHRSFGIMKDNEVKPISLPIKATCSIVIGVTSQLCFQSHHCI